MNTEQLAKFQVLMEEMPAIIKNHKVMAAYQKGKYDNYIEAGFTENQALVLCCKEYNDNEEEED